MSLWSLFDSYATAIRPAISKGSLGGTQQDFAVGDPGVTVLFSNMACSYQEASVNVMLMYAQRDQQATTTLLFGQDPGDCVNALIQLTRGRIGDTLNLLVVGTRDPIQMGQTWVWPLDCLRIRQPA